MPEVDALAGAQAGGEGQFDIEGGIGGGIDDAGVVTVGQEVENLDDGAGNGERKG